MGPGIDSHHFQQLFLFNGIDFIDHQHRRRATGRNLANQLLLLGTDVGDGLHQQEGGVHVSHGFLHHVDHIVAQLGSGLVESGGVQEHQLRLPAGQNAADPVAGGLGLIGYNGDFFPHNGVCQSGLAHVGPPGNGNHSGFGHSQRSSFIYLVSSSCAMMVSSWRRIWRFMGPSSRWS